MYTYTYTHVHVWWTQHIAAFATSYTYMHPHICMCDEHNTLWRPPQWFRLLLMAPIFYLVLLHPHATSGCMRSPIVRRILCVLAWQDDSRSRCSAHSFLGPLGVPAPSWPRWVTRVRVEACRKGLVNLRPASPFADSSRVLSGTSKRRRQCGISN